MRQERFVSRADIDQCELVCWIMEFLTPDAIRKLLNGIPRPKAEPSDENPLHN